MTRISLVVLTAALWYMPAIPAQEKKPDKEYASVWVDLGFKHLKDGKLAKAEECYKRALEYDPDYVQAHANLTVVYFRTKRWPQLVQSANAAVRLGTISTAPKHTGVWRWTRRMRKSRRRNTSRPSTTARR
jgi:Tfp pilus assembly protein PilF